MIKKDSRDKLRRKRHIRVRKIVNGTAQRPRLSLFRSLKNIQVQIVDDEKQVSFLTVSTASAELKGKFKNGGNIQAAKEVGQLIAQKAIAAGYKKVVFDRGGYLYHGRVKALADAARAAGLEF